MPLINIIYLIQVMIKLHVLLSIALLTASKSSLLSISEQDHFYNLLTSITTTSSLSEVSRAQTANDRETYAEWSDAMEWHGYNWEAH